MFLECVRAVFEISPRPLTRCWNDLAARLVELHPSIEARDMQPGSTLRCAPFCQAIRDKRRATRNAHHFSLLPNAVGGACSIVGTIGGSRNKIELPASEERVMLWRNYLSLACAIGAWGWGVA